MDISKIRAELGRLSDAGYARFSVSLLPGVQNLLGVRLPELRRMARLIAADDWRAFLDAPYGVSFEETMLRGMVIGCADMSADECLRRTEDFLPHIDNWSVCDSFCAGFALARRQPDVVWAFILPMLVHPLPYHRRFAVVMMLDYYLDDTYAGAVRDALTRVDCDHPYVSRAVAWAMATLGAHYPQEALALLRSCLLDADTHNRAIQKICESRRTSADLRAQARALRRNTRKASDETPPAERG